MNTKDFNRRTFLKGIGALGAVAGLGRLAPAYSQTNAGLTGLAQNSSGVLSGDFVNLTIAETSFRVGKRTATAMTINGTVPGPIIRLKEGQDVTLNVTNRLSEDSSIHWHGILVPFEMDGVPGVSFAGIQPNETFVYKFPIKQYGTYWYHSHTFGQLELGVYAPLIIDPIEPEPFRYDRDYAVVLSDWSFDSPRRIVGNMKKMSGYYNFQRLTMGDFFADVKKNGWNATWANYSMWAKMRMDQTDIADVTGSLYTYLMNGLAPESNWTGLFKPGERVRLRFIAGGSMSIFDVRIPGLKMTVVQADGQNIQPVEVDEFRIAAAETYDVIVEPKDDKAYTIFAESIDRSGYARGTLAPQPGMTAEIPKRRPRPLRTMDDMGMDMSQMNMAGMQMGGMDMKAGGDMKDMPGMEMGNQKMPMPQKTPQTDGMQMPNMEMAGMNMGGNTKSEIPGSMPVPHSNDHHGPGNQMSPQMTKSRLSEPGTGLGNDGWRVLLYTDLKALTPYPDRRAPERELEIHVTGNMERFMWSFDGKKFSEASEPIPFRFGERLRWTFVNDTMMEHPLHLHGMFMELENGSGDYLPRKHTISVKPAERVSVAITVDAPGRWAFHCHLQLHMEAGMFRVIGVPDGGIAEASK